jgi:hypothetical protein
MNSPIDNKYSFEEVDEYIRNNEVIKSVIVDLGGTKHCTKNRSHIYTADVPFCPYCNMSSEARIYAVQEKCKQEKLENKTKQIETKKNNLQIEHKKKV